MVTARAGLRVERGQLRGPGRRAEDEVGARSSGTRSGRRAACRRAPRRRAAPASPTQQDVSATRRLEHGEVAGLRVSWSPPQLGCGRPRVGDRDGWQLLAVERWAALAPRGRRARLGVAPGQRSSHRATRPSGRTTRMTSRTTASPTSVMPGRDGIFQPPRSSRARPAAAVPARPRRPRADDRAGDAREAADHEHRDDGEGERRCRTCPG